MSSILEIAYYVYIVCAVDSHLLYLMYDVFL